MNSHIFLRKILGMLTVLSVFAGLNSSLYAETTSQTAAKEYVLEVNGKNGQEVSVRAARDQWEKKHIADFQVQQDQASMAKKAELEQRKATRLIFPKPLSFNETHGAAVDKRDWLALVEPLLDLILPAKAEAATYGNMNIDGNLSDWKVEERINFDKPPYLFTPNSFELYGKFVATNSVYLVALKSNSPTIGINTTLWLNTDQNSDTGLTLFGPYVGAEYSVNVDKDGKPYLYNIATGTSVSLDYSVSADNTILELAIPSSLLGLNVPRDIDLVGDLNAANDATDVPANILYFPQYYSYDTQYTIPVEPLPVRTDLSKRVGIVFSETSKNNFYNDKAYSQLFMAMQNQARMAGIPFDLLTENDLTDLKKLVNYDALLFPYAQNIPKKMRNKVSNNLYNAIYRLGVGVITADNFMTNDENNKAFSGDSYQTMKPLLGVTREGGASAVTVDLFAGDISHPAMRGYAANESVLLNNTSLASLSLNAYKNTNTSYFQPIAQQAVTTLANQTINNTLVKPAALAISSPTGVRRVHFASISLMADSPLVWQALQWVVYGDKTPVALTMGRNRNLFVSRNDMDQSQQYADPKDPSIASDDMPNVDIPLYNFLNTWKAQYNFVGSYYINIGNNPPDQQTVWLTQPTPTAYDSQPLYKKYLALGNEIGTHSWTHPEDTNLASLNLDFEFRQSMDKIGDNLNPTWQTFSSRGGAVPGAPEGLAVAKNILQYLDYLSGGASLIGAGYPNAIGYLTPSDTKVYFSPNMSFDFTMVNFGVPKGSPAVPFPLTAAQAQQYWVEEYDRLMHHAAQPIIHWPWHDYGPTSATKGTPAYTVAMFQNTIDHAFKTGAEFITAADAAQRITAFGKSKLTVTQNANQYTVQATGANLGKFALGLNLPAGQKIQNVTNWYAYNDTKVFLDDDGGAFVVQAGTVADVVSHITELPMRAKLLSVSGDGKNLQFSFEGEGVVNVALTDAPSVFQFDSTFKKLATDVATADSFSVSATTGNVAQLKFANFGLHTVTMKLGTPVVTVYRDMNYLGTAQGYVEGTYASTSGMFDVLGNDQISSIKVTPGYTVKACMNADASGGCLTLTANSSYVGNAFNDKISYLQITKTINKSAIFGGLLGSTFTDTIASNQVLTGVNVRSGWWLDALQGVSNLGTLVNHGGTGGSLVNVVWTTPDEYLVRVYGKYGSYIGQISFVTNKGKVYGPYGTGQGGNNLYNFDLQAPANNEIIGFTGRAGQFLNAIGILYRVKS